MQDQLSGGKVSQSHIGRFPAVAAIFAAGIGVFVLGGWAWEVDELKRVLSGLVSMNPLTAVSFILVGVSLWLLRHPQVCPHTRLSAALRRVAQLCAGLVLGFGLLHLFQYVLGWGPGIDQVLFASQLVDDDPDFPNRMAPNTAIGFLFVGSALLLLDTRPGKGLCPAEGLALLTGLISLLAVIGYAYQIERLFGVGPFMPMALHTAAVFFVLAMGLLFARPGWGMMEMVMSEGPGGLLARRFFPAMLLTISLFGWLRLEGSRRGLYSDESGVVLYTMTSIVVFVALIGWSAWSLHHADSVRKQREVDIRRLNADLESRAAELEAANGELESFSYSVSHDLRAPLRHIHGYVEMLSKATEDQLSEKPRRYLKNISEASQEMGQLIDDLLAFSRMARVEMSDETVDLNELLAELIRGVATGPRERDVTWTVGSLPEVRGDRSMLKQALANLVENAVKYTRNRDRATIEIGCFQQTAGWMTLFVRDNGAGFDMRYAHKLFGVFQRLHRADEFEGTGIGLANVRRIVSRHGGRTWAEGELDNGATFFITLKTLNDKEAL